MPKAARVMPATTSHRPTGHKSSRPSTYLKPEKTADIAIKILRATTRHMTLSQKLQAHDALERELRSFHDELLNELDAEHIPL